MKPVHIPESAPGIIDLHMENDLLTHENRILRARLEGSFDYEAPEATQPTQSADFGVEQERFRRAYYDLRWLIRRLNSSPLGFVLRRWEGFRVLVERYGRSEE